MGGGNSGGGSSGKSSWPAYMERMHWALGIGAFGTDQANPNAGLWSTRASDYVSEANYYSVLRDITEAHDDSPFETAEAYDPEARLSNISTQISALTTLVNALDYTTDYGTDWDTAQAQIDEIVSDTEKTALVTQFEADTAKAHANAMARMSAGAADIGVNNDAAYIMAKAMMEQGYVSLVGSYTASIANRQYELKLNMYDSAVQQLGQRMLAVVESQRIASGLKVESERISIVAEKEEIDRNIELDIQDHTWEMESWQYGANILGSISGSIGSPGHQKPSNNSALGGALAGAGAGASIGGSIGSLIPVPGAALAGAGIGAAIFGTTGALAA